MKKKSEKKKQPKLLKKLLTYLKSMKSTILITKSRSELFCPFLVFLVLSEFFGRALLQPEGKPRTTVHQDSRSNKHHHEEVHWSLVNLGRCRVFYLLRLPHLISPFYCYWACHFYISSFYIAFCFAVLSKLSPHCRAAVKLMLLWTKKPAARDQEPSMDFSNAFALQESSFWEEGGDDRIRCSFHLAKWEILTRRQRCQMGNLKSLGKSWDGLDETHIKLFFRIARCSSKETKFLFISHHLHAPKLWGESAKISFTVGIKNIIQIFIFIISVQCRIHVCSSKRKWFLIWFSRQHGKYSHLS